MSKKQNKRHVLFWIKSSRGTDAKAIFEIPNNWTKENIKSALEKWCSGFGAWTHGENAINYGWKSIRITRKKELEKKYALACKRRANAIEKWQILAAMLNIRTLN